MKKSLNAKMPSMGKAVKATTCCLLFLCAIAGPQGAAGAEDANTRSRGDASGKSWRPMTFSTATGPSGESILLASGEVGPTSAADLGNALSIATRSDERVTLYIDSPGGDFIGGVELGKAIRRAGVSTVAGSMTSQGETAGVCASACVYAFIGGVERRTTAGSKIGLHQMRAEQGAASASDIQSAAGVALMHTLEMGVSAEALIAALVIGHDDIYWFSEDDLLRTGITTTVTGAPVSQSGAEIGAEIGGAHGALVSARPPSRNPPSEAARSEAAPPRSGLRAAGSRPAASPSPNGGARDIATGLFSSGSNRATVAQPEIAMASGSWRLVSEARGARLESGGPRASHDGGPAHISISCPDGRTPSATITVDGSGLTAQDLGDARVSAMFSIQDAGIAFRQKNAALDGGAAPDLGMTAAIPAGFLAAILGGGGDIRIWAEETTAGAAMRSRMRATAIRRLGITIDAPDDRTVAQLASICNR